MAIEGILVVDDDIRTRELLSAFLSASGYRVSFAQSGREAAGLLALNPYDLVITDMYMPDGDGIEVIQHLRRNHPLIRIIAMTGPWVIGAADYLNQARSLTVDGILMKPFLREHLLSLIDTIQTAPAYVPEYFDH